MHHQPVPDLLARDEEECVSELEHCRVVVHDHQARQTVVLLPRHRRPVANEAEPECEGLVGHTDRHHGVGKGDCDVVEDHELVPSRAGLAPLHATSAPEDEREVPSGDDHGHEDGRFGAGKHDRSLRSATPIILLQRPTCLLDPDGGET